MNRFLVGLLVLSFTIGLLGGITFLPGIVHAEDQTEDEAKRKARELTDRLGELEGREAERARKEATAREENERSRLEQQGQYQQALEHTKKQWTSQFDEYRSKVSSALVPSAIKAALAKVQNVSPEVADDLPKLISEKVRLNHDTMTIEVLGDDGKPALDADLKPVTVDAYVQEFIKGRPYMLLDRQAPGTGMKPGRLTGDSTPDFGRAMRDPSYAETWRKADPEGYFKAEKEYWTPSRMMEKARKVSGMG